MSEPDLGDGAHPDDDSGLLESPHLPTSEGLISDATTEMNQQSGRHREGVQRMCRSGQEG